MLKTNDGCGKVDRDSGKVGLRLKQLSTILLLLISYPHFIHKIKRLIHADKTRNYPESKS
jgi:hypothetical protein